MLSDNVFQLGVHVITSPLISISCSSETGSPLIGSVPFSAMYFSISRLSNTQLEEGETQGCSGTSLLTKKYRVEPH